MDSANSAIYLRVITLQTTAPTVLREEPIDNAANGALRLLSNVNTHIGGP